MPIASATSTETKMSDKRGEAVLPEAQDPDHAEADPREDGLAPARDVTRDRDDQREQPSHVSRARPFVS